MRKLVALALLALALVACGYSNPGNPTPTVLGTQAPAAPHY